MIFLFLKLHKKQICVRIRRKPGLSRKSEIPLKFKELHVSLHLFACIGACKVFFDELGIIIGSPLGNLHPASTAIHAHPFFTPHPPHPPSLFTIHYSTTPSPIFHSSYFIFNSPQSIATIPLQKNSKHIHRGGKPLPKNSEHIHRGGKPLPKNLKHLHRGGKATPRKFEAPSSWWQNRSQKI